MSDAFLDHAIEAHAKWKIRLLAAVNGGEIPERHAVAVDNACDLGRWIHGDATKRYGNAAELKALREAHQHFHATLGSVIDLLKAGNKEGAKRVILSGEYAHQSQEVVRTIAALKKLAA